LPAYNITSNQPNNQLQSKITLLFNMSMPPHGFVCVYW